MSDDPNCPGCGAAVNLNTNGLFLIGRKIIPCPSCGVEIVATARISA